MADIQRKDARKLLNIIAASVEKSKKLTYLEAARRLGRGPHSRAVAQMCDLLDAAACLAGVPLLALVWVRGKSGEINSKAWKEYAGFQRDAIINRSLSYQFGSDDYKAIANALDNLGLRGNRKAWLYVTGLYPGDLLYRRVTGEYGDAKSNAIDDLGTDAPDRAKAEVWLYPRDPKMREAVLFRAKGRCELCDELGFVKPDLTHYLESHHVIALAKDGADRTTNVIALCPNDHREAHFGNRSEEVESEMIFKLRAMHA